MIADHLTLDAALNDWRELVLAEPDEESRWQQFTVAVYDLASFIHRGENHVHVGKRMNDLADQTLLSDHDRRSAIIAEAIAREQAKAKSAFRQTCKQFVADFVPPDYLLDGVLIRRFLYSFTGRTGSGKTAVTLLIAASVALERKIGDLEVAAGRVFYFCGENPEDVRMRWIALAQRMGFDPNTIDVHFFPGRFKISEMCDKIVAEAEALGGVALVIVDTSAAYYEGDDPNNNAQQVTHGLRLRELANLPGGPTVLVNCHPVKNATPENLIPYGGGAFLNEVDGNLTCALNGVTVEVGWQGKLRGPDFPPLCFRTRSVTHERLKDSRGRLLPTVIAEYLSEVAQQEIAKVARSREDQLLAEIESDGSISIAEYARRLRWALRSGGPHKSLVHRTLEKLKTQKLVTPDRDGYALTEKGRKALAKNRSSCWNGRTQPSHRSETGTERNDDGDEEELTH